MPNNQSNINQLYKMIDDPNPIAEIRFLTESQECDFIEFFAYLDMPEISFHGRKFKEEDILQKLFVNIDSNGNIKRRTDIDIKSPLFLKNKYLYLYGEGAAYYLQARQDMSKEKNALDSLERKVLQKFLGDKMENLKVVSLGSANAVKEIDVLHNLYTNSGSSRSSFIFVPIDVSLNLIQLAILYFYKKFQKGRKGDIKPIIGDIWDVTKQKDAFFPSDINGITVFTLLGSTLGNYREKEFLLKILALMREHDIFIFGVDILANTPDNESAYIYEQYNTLGNVQFMLNPLSYIPKFKGYIEKFDKYFRLDKPSSIVFPTHERYVQLTDVDKSVCYAPLLELPIEIGGGDRAKMSVAQSTKYNYNELVDFISKIEDKDSEGNTIKFEIDENNSERNYRAACIVLKKIVKLNTKEDIRKLTETINPLLLQFAMDESTQKNKDFVTKYKSTRIEDPAKLKLILSALTKTLPPDDLPPEIINLL